MGHNPLSALGTGREVGQDLCDHLGLLDNTGICHDCQVLPCLRRIRHKTNKAPTARSPITIVGPPFSLTLPTGPPDTPPQRIRGPPGGREKQLFVTHRPSPPDLRWVPQERSLMNTVRVELDESLAALLHQTNQSAQDAAREMIVLELYRRGVISSGKAGELLNRSRVDFIQYASHLGIPLFAATADEWAAEKATIESL